MKKGIAILLAMVLLIAFVATASAGGEYVVRLSSGHLNMRSHAGTSYTVILYIPNNTPVDDKGDSLVYANSLYWRHIGSWGYLSGEASGYSHYKSGWVANKYLSPL